MKENREKLLKLVEKAAAKVMSDNESHTTNYFPIKSRKSYE